MSLKDEIKQIAECRFRLEAGVPLPVDIFMSEKLVADSEHLLWDEVATIANFAGVKAVSVTPDAHASGNGIPVGIAVATEDTIIPCAAGYDISCGMAAVRTSLTLDDVRDNAKVRAWINAIEARVATGKGKHRADNQASLSPREFQAVLEQGANAFEKDQRVLANLERTHLPVDMARLVQIDQAQRGEGQIGSLGGGNHFLELDIDSDGKVWILIHTGSRGYGHGTADWFFRAGAELLGLPPKDKEKSFFYVDSVLGQQYENNMNAAANFAIVNRLAIYRAVAAATQEALGGDCSLYYEISHNLVQREGGLLMHRKGATRAFPAGHEALNSQWRATGHPILIPGSMGTASAILFAAPGAKDSCYSINHGCGRVLGRKQAKRELADRQEQIDLEMAGLGILTNTRHTPLDECSHAYKSIDEVLAAVERAGLAKVQHSLRPRAVIKGFD